MTSPRLIRPAHIGDAGFIIASWAGGMRKGCLSRFEPDELYWPGQHELIKRILGSAAAAVSCDPVDTHNLFGAIVWQPGPLAVLHWCFVKGEHRRKGIGRELLTYAVADAPRIYCTQATKDFDRFDQSRFIHAPHLLWGIMPLVQMPAVQETTSVHPEQKPAA